MLPPGTYNTAAQTGAWELARLPGFQQAVLIHTKLVTVKRRKQKSLLARQMGNMKTSQLSSVAGASIYSDVTCSIYQVFTFSRGFFVHSLLSM